MTTMARRARTRWIVAAIVGSVVLVGLAVLARELFAVRSILGLDDAECAPSLTSSRLPDNAESDDGRWQLAPTYPIGRDEVRAAAVGNRIYVGTGLTLSDGEFVSLDEFFGFDPARGTFQTLPDVPTQVDHPALLGHRGALYVVGGFVKGMPSASVWRFSPKTQLWQELSPMRIARGSPAAAAIGNRIYVVGGSREDRGSAEALSTLEIYDITSGRWSRGPAMPTARHHHGAAAVGGRLVVVGGRNDEDLSSDAVEQFDPARGKWTRLSPLPFGVGGLSVVAVPQGILVAGGGDDEEQWVTPATWVLDPDKNTWRRLADLNVARHGHAAAALGSDVYVFAGAPCPGYGRSDSVELLKATDGASG